MANLRNCLILALAVVLTAAMTQAQPGGDKPGPEFDILKKMEGNWDATMKMHGTESKCTCSYKMDIGGKWLASKFEGDMGGMTFHGRGFDTYDAAKKKYVGVWLDSMSSAPMVMEGTYDKASKTMTMEGMGMDMEGKPAKHKAHTVMKDDNTMHFTMYMGDMKEAAFTIEYKRKK